MKNTFRTLILIYLLFVSCGDNTQSKIEVIDLENIDKVTSLNDNKNKNEIYVAISTMISPVETFNINREI